MAVPTRNHSIIIDGLIFSSPNVVNWKVETFVHDGSDKIILENEFFPGSTRLLVDGLEWCPNWYTEDQDERKKWRVIKLSYPIPNGANCWVRYYDAPIIV